MLGFITLKPGLLELPACTQTQWRTQKIFIGGFIHWHMLVIYIWCALFVTSYFDESTHAKFFCN